MEPESGRPSLARAINVRSAIQCFNCSTSRYRWVCIIWNTDHVYFIRHRKQPTWHNETMALGFKSKFSASSVASEYSSLGLKGCDIILDLARPTSTAQRRGWFPRLVTISVLSFPPTQEFWYIQMAVWVQEKLVLP